MLRQLLYGFRSKLALYARLTRPYVRGVLYRQGSSILDVGCGKGESLSFIGRRFFSVGVDIFQPYLKDSKRQGLYDELVLCDVRALPFTRKSFDMVICLDVVEHLEKKDGEKLIEDLEEKARSQVVICVPLGMFKQAASEGNPYAEHRAAWNVDDLVNLGFKIRGFGLRGLYDDDGLRFRLPVFIAVPFCSLVFALSTFLAFFFPTIANEVVGIKKLTFKGVKNENC